MENTYPEKTLSEAEQYGLALGRLRKRAQLTQGEAAKLINANQQTWQRYETGANNAFLSVPLQKRLTEALGFTLEDLHDELENARQNLPLSPARRSAEPSQRQADDRALLFPLDGVVKASPQGFAVYDGGPAETFDMGRVLDHNTRILRVAGESMVPVLEPGSFVTYDATGVPKRNSLAVIRLKDGQYFVKRYVRTTASQVECVEMEAYTVEGRTAYVEKPVFYTLKDVAAVYPAGARID
ncbi:LexA family transcriptional regulator [Asticcacaulis taihuensis]|uniref:LexA family transcriptional regulator n=1 Tax=Asticcacaulis taihuensis TaxID=260084 RepID=UPI0026F21030|nr:LexA family transcriptional regulator [Asticcacaulis taihuensis]